MAKQNKGRKFFATSATAALVASAIVPVASAATFTDADKIGTWAQESVDFLADKEIITGNPDGSFNPQGKITRAESAKMFTKALDLSTEGTEDFSDVTEGQWFHEFVVAVSNAEIVNGVGEGLFAPKANLTRAEAAKMIVEAYDLTGEADLSDFADANTVAGKWSEKYLSTAVANGVINGKNGKLAASESITRQEFAVMFKRAIDAAEVDPAAELVEALTALETATKALPKEVTVDTVIDAKEAVAAVQATITEAKAALDAAVKAEAVTEKEVTEAKAAIEASVAAIKATEKAIEAAKEFEVSSVTAINATQVEVKFSKAIDESTLASGDITLTSLNNVNAGTLTYALSEDGKTVTVTAQNALSQRYDVVVDGLKSTDGKDIKKFVTMLTIEADIKAPTITGTEQISANKVKINFSEPVKAHTTATLKYADGTTVNGASVSVAAGATSVIVDLSASTVDVNKAITVTFIGLQDQAGNLLTPNPGTVTITKQQVDGVKPTVSTVTQTGAKTFNVKFSKDLTAAPTVAVSGYTVDSITKVSASEYKVTVTTNLTGVQNVTVTAGYTDLAGQVGDAITKVVTFSADTVAPKATSAKAVTVNGVEYLELTFDKDVTEGDVTVSGSYNKDYVTTPVAGTTVPATYASSSSKKVLRTPLSGFATVEGGVYTLGVTSATVTSLSGTAFEKTSATFTRGKDVAGNTTKLAAPVVAQGTTNDKVTVTFTGAVDGASATNIANYKVDGAVVESAELGSLGAVTAGEQVVTLNLKKDSNAFTGTRNITVENVKALGSSVTMDKHIVNTLSLNENVRATVTKAVLTGNQEITLTFSEVVYDTTNVAAADFDLYIGATKATATLTTESVASGSAKNTLKLTITGTLTADDLAKGLSIKAATNLDVKDFVDNGLNITTVAVTQ